MVGTMARCLWTVSGAPTGESCATVVEPISISKPFGRCLDVMVLPWPPRDGVFSPLPRLTPLPATSGSLSREDPPVSSGLLAGAPPCRPAADGAASHWGTVPRTDGVDLAGGEE